MARVDGRAPRIPVTVRRLAVLGSPIEHSLSPRLHGAAYEVLGLPWQYGRHEIGKGGLDPFLTSLSPEWRGLSLTMPLKDEAFARAEILDDAARETGAVNTLVLGERLRGLNTDVPGIVDAFAERGVLPGERVALLGAGATARSVVVALARMGVGRIDVFARRFEAAAQLVEYAAERGLEAQVLPAGATIEAPGLVVSTFPGDAAPDLPRLRLDGSAELFDVAYSDSASVVRSWWKDAGGPSPRVDGLDMLIGQALRQIRVFATDDVEAELPHEGAVRRAMRAAVGRS